MGEVDPIVWRHAKDGTLKHAVRDRGLGIALCGFRPAKGWVAPPIHGGGDLTRRTRCPKCENRRDALGLPR